MVTVAYRRWSFTGGSNCKALTSKVFVFWIKAIAYGRWSLTRESPQNRLINIKLFETIEINF